MFALQFCEISSSKYEGFAIDALQKRWVPSKWVYCRASEIYSTDREERRYCKVSYARQNDLEAINAQSQHLVTSRLMVEMLGYSNMDRETTKTSSEVGSKVG